MESLCLIQEEIYSKICKNVSSLQEIPSESLTELVLETRLEHLEKQWNLYCETHYEIIRKTNREVYEKSDYYVNECYDRTEEMYLDFKVELKEKLVRRKVLSKVSVAMESGDNSETCRNIKLPEIIIPQFSGLYTEWSSFKELFVSLIHENKALSDVHKLHYLKCYLTGEAEQLVRHISVTGDNYTLCWNRLEKRYENKRFLANCILGRLLSQKDITFASSKEIKGVLDTTTECLKALENLDIKVNEWDTIIIYLISQKLDIETRKQWECHVSKNILSRELPTLNEFIDFLSKQFRALEYLDIEVDRTEVREHTVSCHVGNINQTNHKVQCKFCAGEHRLAFCKKFPTEDCTSRRNFVQRSGICFNCLGDNHSAKYCRNPTRCGICEKRHHLLLHIQESTQVVSHFAAMYTHHSAGKDFIESEYEQAELYDKDKFSKDERERRSYIKNKNYGKNRYILKLPYSRDSSNWRHRNRDDVIAERNSKFIDVKKRNNSKDYTQENKEGRETVKNLNVKHRDREKYRDRDRRQEAT